MVWRRRVMKCEFWITNFLFLFFYLHHEAEHAAGAGTSSLPNHNRCQVPGPKACTVPGKRRWTGKAWRETAWTAWGPRDWRSFTATKINTTQIQTHETLMSLQCCLVYAFSGKKKTVRIYKVDGNSGSYSNLIANHNQTGGKSWKSVHHKLHMLRKRQE